MNNLFLPFFILIAINALGQSRNDGYQLVWSDEFEIDGPPDTTRWRFEQGFVRNNEDQWYQKENARCEDGLLIIEGRRETKPNPWYDPEAGDWKRSRKMIEYTSSSLNTRGQYSWHYGRMEVRAKIDAQQGLWPAIWTLGISGEWPSNGEVDVMEYYDHSILANFAWGTGKRFTPQWDGVKKPLSDFGDPQWSEQFHTWTLEWDSARMAIYVDDELLNEVDLNTTFNQGDGKNPFRQPHYILLNLAIGGNAGGDPSAAEFPTRYMVDYVRVYQKE